jgi:hypothetical protein
VRWTFLKLSLAFWNDGTLSAHVLRTQRTADNPDTALISETRNDRAIVASVAIYDGLTSCAPAGKSMRA